MRENKTPTVSKKASPRGIKKKNSDFQQQWFPEWSWRSFRRKWWRTSGGVWRDIFELLLLGKIVRSIFHQNSTANFTIKLHYEVLGFGGPYKFSFAIISMRMVHPRCPETCSNFETLGGANSSDSNRRIARLIAMISGISKPMVCQTYGLGAGRLSRQRRKSRKRRK